MMALIHCAGLDLDMRLWQAWHTYCDITLILLCFAVAVLYCGYGYGYGYG